MYYYRERKEGQISCVQTLQRGNNVVGVATDTQREEKMSIRSWRECEGYCKKDFLQRITIRFSTKTINSATKEGNQ